MANELAFILINPYTISKSRTGGVIGRFVSRTGLELVGARMFAPSRQLAEEYAAIVGQDRDLEPEVRELLTDYVLKNYSPDRSTGQPRRLMMILLEGENALQKVRNTAGSVVTGSGETIRDTFGDYVVDEEKKVKYFEPAVLIGSSMENAASTLRLWSRYSHTDGGLLMKAVDVYASSAQWQRTFVLIKPDNFTFPSARPGNIIDMLSRSGLRITAAKVHRMSVVQAEGLYRPVLSVLREKMKTQVGEKTIKLLKHEFNIEIPANIRSLIEDNIGPLVGDEQFNQLVKFMTGYYPPQCTQEEKTKHGKNRCLALVYEGPDAVEKIRRLLGPTDPDKAQPGSIRRELGHDIMLNAVHASDSAENAEQEIAIIKVEEDLITPLVKKYYGA